MVAGKKKVSVCMVALVVVCMAAGWPKGVESMTCGQVTGDLMPCLDYLRNGGQVVPAACCTGVRSLNAQATSTADRQATCNCLKSIAGSMKSIDYGRVAAVPGKCGVSVPYPISPSTDCSKVR